MHSLKIFVSSTVLDLQDERAEVEQALRRLRGVDFVGMEHFGAHDAGAEAVSLQALDTCDVYVGLIGWQRGSGITANEYRRALERGLPCLIYQRRIPPGVPTSELIRDAAQAALREEMRKRHVVVDFDSPQDLALRVIADLHRLLLDRVIAPVAGGLAYEADMAIRRFVDEYSGNAAEPSIFGGRAEELAQLDDWIDNSCAPPYAVVTAPAGRGKSALLVHWLKHHAGRANLQPIFFPISIRFHTNLAIQAYSSIASRLAAVHGDVLACSDYSASEVWRGLLLDYLSRPLPEGTRVVIVIDGADEGGDWSPGADLLPTRPPAGLKILVSARYLTGDNEASGWLQRLGCERSGQALAIDLRPLTPAEVVALLGSLSVPLERLSERSDIVAELYRLSEGDPLMVKLYVADLWSQGDGVARLQPQDLRNIEPGLKGYFRRWWDDQRALWGQERPLREPAVNDVLNTLACALGPLSKAELMALLPPGSVLDIWSLDDTLHVLRRFVVGDGCAQGYVFGHPRLAEFFFEQLSSAGRAQQHEQRFVDWGLACLRARREPDAARRPAIPHYITQFLRRHMERCGCTPVHMAELVSSAWMEAWEPLDRGSHSGFLTDITHAVSYLAANHAHCPDQPWTLVPVDLRAVLFTSSIASRAADLSVHLLSTMAQRKVWSPAQAIAQVSRVPALPQRLARLVCLGVAIEPDFQPLVMAPLVAELRTLTAAEPPWGDWAEVVAMFDSHADYQGCEAVQGARLAFIARACRQLDETKRTRLMDALLPTLPPSRAAVLRRLLPWLDDGTKTAVRRKLESQATARARSRLHLDDPDVAERLREFAYLRAPPTAADMRARATAALAVVLQRIHMPGAVAHAIELAALLPDQVPEIVKRTGSGASSDELVRLVQESHANRLPQDRARVRLRALRFAAGPLRDTWQAEALSALGEPSLRDEPAIGLVAEAAAALEGNGLLSALNALLPRVRMDRFLVALASALPCIEDQTRLLLASMVRDSLLHPDVCDASLDCTRPAGVRDSLTHRLYTPANANLCSALRRLFRSIPLAVDSIISQSPPPGSMESASSPADTPSSDDVDDLVTRLESMPPASLTEMLKAALDHEREFKEGKVREAVARLLDNHDDVQRDSSPDYLLDVAELACAPSLRPPEQDTILVLVRMAMRLGGSDHRPLLDLLRQAGRRALPDNLRCAWLRLAWNNLVAISSEDPFGLRSADVSTAVDQHLEALLDLLRLADPDPDLVLALLSHPFKTHSESLRRLLVALCARCDTLPAGTVFAALVRRAAGGGDTVEDLLGAARSASSLSDAQYLDEVLAAASSLPTERQKAIALEWLVPELTATHLPKALALLADIRDGNKRLGAFCRIAAGLSHDQRCLLLPDVLAMLTEGHGGGDELRQVIDIAVADGAVDDTTRAELLAVIMRQPDPLLRQRLFARLSASLDDEALRTATTRLQRINDAASIARTLAALARRCAAHPDAAPATARLLAGLDAVQETGVQHSSLLGFASLLPPAQRWPRLMQAFNSRERLPVGFDAAEIMADLPRALENAPGRVGSAAIEWIARCTDLRDPAVLPIALAPHLSPSAAWSAASRHARCNDARWDACFAPADLDRLQQRVDRLQPAQQRLLHALVERRCAQRPMGPDERILAHELDARLVHCHDALDVAEVLRAWALSRDADASQLPSAVTAFGDVQVEPLRSDTLAYLALHAGSAQAGDALPWVATIRHPGDRAWALIRISDQLPTVGRETALAQALQALYDDPDPISRVAAATQWALRAPEQVAAVAPAFLQVARDPQLVPWLTLVLGRLPDAAAATALRGLVSLDDPTLRENLLGALDAPLGQAAALEVLRGIDGLAAHAARARVLVRVAPLLPDACEAAATQCIDRLEVDFAWLLALRALAQRWPAAWTAERLARALPALDSLGDADDRVDWLNAALPCIPEVLWPAFFAAVAELPAPAMRAELLACVARRRADVATGFLVEQMRDISDPFQRAVALGQLATARDEPALWPALLVDASRGGGRVAEVEALACIAVAAQRVAPQLLTALLQRHARLPRQVMTALKYLAHLFDDDQVQIVLDELPGERESLAQALTPSDPVEARVLATPASRFMLFQSLQPEIEAPAPTPEQARSLLACWLAATPPTNEVPEWPTPQRAGPVPTPASLQSRLTRIESMGDRLQIAQQMIDKADDEKLTALLGQLATLLAPPHWAMLVRRCWPRWVRLDAEAAVRHAFDRLAHADALALLVEAPRDALACARPALHTVWRRWVGGIRTTQREQVLQELTAMAPVLEAVGDESVLLRSMDEILETAQVWP